MEIFDPEKMKHENPLFREDEVKNLCDILRLNIVNELILRMASWGRSIPDQLNKLLVAIDTLSPSNADFERGFSAMNEQYYY